MYNNLIENIYKSKSSRPLILDGAIGSYLQEKGFSADKYLWYSYLNIERPEIVEMIHREYINAGADIITTNTFRTNPFAKKRSDLKISNQELVKKSVEIAIKARESKPIVIAGSNAPAEDCYQVERTISFFELEYNHKKHIEMLIGSGVDIIWNETHSHLDEIELISKFCDENKINFAMNLFFKHDLTILSGEPLNEIVRLIENYNPALIGFNCIKPEIFIKNIDRIYLPKNWGFYFNCGAGNYEDEIISCGISPNNYLNQIKFLMEYKPKFVGACCGSNPAHIKLIKEYLNEIHRD